MVEAIAAAVVINAVFFLVLRGVMNAGKKS